MKYMLIDVTTVENTRVLLIADLERVQLLGKLLQAEGKKVMAPPMEGRGFSKLDKAQLQYLYWNTIQKTPSEVYEFLINECLAVFESMPMDQTDVRELQAKVAALTPETAESTEPGAEPIRPKMAGSTGKVWEIADQVYAAKGGAIDRKAIIEACEAAGINGATAATQFAKWKKSKSI